MNRVYMKLRNDKLTVFDSITDKPIVSFKNDDEGNEKCSTLVDEHNAEVDEYWRKKATDEFRALAYNICVDPFVSK